MENTLFGVVISLLRWHILSEVNPSKPRETPLAAWSRYRIPAWAADAVAAVLMLVFLFIPELTAPWKPPGLLATATVLVGIVSLPLSRRWPLRTSLIVLALFFCVDEIVPPAEPGDSPSPTTHIALLLLFYRCGAAGKLHQTLVVLGVTCVLLAALIATRATASLDYWVLLFIGISLALAGFIGSSVRTRRQELSQAITRALQAEQTREREAKQRVTEERLRIARDLHDTVAHQVAVISLNAGVAIATLETKPEKAKEALGTIRSASRTVLREIGDLLAMLRDDNEPDAGTARFSNETLRALADGFATSGLEVAVTEEGDVTRLRGAPAQAAYWIIQEALTNAHKHGAGRTSVRVETKEEQAVITVSNDLTEHPSPATQPTWGFGLTGLRERVTALDGTLAAGPANGQWRVVVTLPLGEPA